MSAAAVAVLDRAPPESLTEAQDLYVEEGGMMQAALAAWSSEDASGTSGQIAALVGPARAGKSHLLLMLQIALERLGTRVLPVRIGQGLDEYGVLRAILVDLLGTLGSGAGVCPVALQRQLDAVVAGEALQLRRMCDLIGALHGHLSQGEVLVLVLDDFDRLVLVDDEPVPQGLLRALRRLARHPGLRVLTTVRDDCFHVHRAAFRPLAELPPLPEHALVEMYRRRLSHLGAGEAIVSEEFVRQAAADCQGRPGLLWDLLSLLLLREGPRLGELTLEACLERLWAEVTQHCPRSVRDIAVAAHSGTPVPSAVVERLEGTPVAQVLYAEGSVGQRFLVNPVLAAYLRRTTPEPSPGELVAQQRKEADGLYQQAIHNYEQDRRPVAQVLFTQALQRYQTVQDPTGEARVRMRLGKLALLDAALEDAQGHWQRARDLARELGDAALEGDAYLGMGEWALRKHQTAAARINLFAARDIFQRLGLNQREAIVLRELGELAVREDRLTEARSLFQQALALAEDKDKAAVLMRLADVEDVCGSLAVATSMRLEALRMYRAQGSKQGMANCLVDLAGVALRAGGVEQAGLDLREAVRLYQELWDGLGEANAERLFGDLAYRGGNLAQAAQRYRNARNMYQEIGDPLSEAGVGAKLGSTMTALGRYREARTILEEALALARNLAHRQTEANVLMGLGELAAQSTLLPGAEAARWFEEARRAYGEIGERAGIAAALRALGGVARAQGDSREAGALLTQALYLYENSADPLGQADTVLAMSTLALQSGRASAGRDHAQQALKLFRSVEHHQGEAHALGLLGDAALLLGNPDESIRHSRSAAAMYLALGDSSGAARSRYTEGRALATAGKPEEAQEILREAWRLEQQHPGPMQVFILQALANILNKQEQREATALLLTAGLILALRLGILPDKADTEATIRRLSASEQEAVLSQVRRLLQ